MGCSAVSNGYIGYDASGLSDYNIVPNVVYNWGILKIRGTLRGPQNKDYSISGSIVGFIIYVPTLGYLEPQG